VGPIQEILPLFTPTAPSWIISTECGSSSFEVAILAFIQTDSKLKF